MKPLFISLYNLLYGVMIYAAEFLKIKNDKKYPLYYRVGKLFAFGILLSAIDIVFTPTFFYLTSLSRDIVTSMFWKNLWVLSSFCGFSGAIIVMVTFVPFMILVLAAIATNKFKL